MREEAIKHLMKIAERRNANEEYVKEICKRLDKVISNYHDWGYVREQAQKLKKELLEKYGESVPAA